MTQEALRMAHKALVGLSIKHGEMTDEGMDAIAAIKEALAQEKALQALHDENERLGLYKDAYAQQEQKPVAWLLTDKNINSLQVDSIQRLIDRLKHAHHTDLCVRINGQDEWFQADWLKHMVRATPPQRTEPLIGCVNHDCVKCKPLTDEQRQELMSKAWNKWLSGKDDGRLFAWDFSFEVEAAHGIKEDT